MCDACIPPSTVAVSRMAEWWADSLASGMFTRPSQASVKLWLQLAEQAKGLGDTSPQFVAIVETVTRTVRADVLAALKGSRSLDDVPWFSTLQHCPNMADDMLFHWDEYNKWVTDEKAVNRLVKLPSLLSDVVMSSEPTQRLLQRATESPSAATRACALGLILENETIAAIHWARSCATRFVADINSSNVGSQATADACIVAQPSLLERSAVNAAIVQDGPYSAALWRLICSRCDLFPWAIPYHINGTNAELRTLAERCLIDDPKLLEQASVREGIRPGGQYSAALWRLVCSRQDLFPWAAPAIIQQHVNSTNPQLRGVAEQLITASPALLEHASVRGSIRRKGPYSIGLWRLICARQDLFPWATPQNINGSVELRAQAEQLVVDNPVLAQHESVVERIRKKQPFSTALWRLIYARRDLFPWAQRVCASVASVSPHCAF